MTATTTNSAPAADPYQAATGWRARLARSEDFLLGFGTVCALLILWECSARFEWVNPLFTSSPTAIARAFYTMVMDGSLWPHVKISGLELFVGFGLAIIAGVPLGILMGWYRRFNAAVDPVVSALYATPRIALLPLIMIWFGIGLGSKFAVIFLSSFFPILINTAVGVRTVDPDYIKVARSYDASDWQIFHTVVLPASVPFLLTGLRLGVGHALIGVVVAELYTAQAGVGFLIAMSGQTFQTDKVFVGILIIASSGVALTGILRAIERRFDRWRASSHV